jgi:hypothetical protein
LHGAADGDDIAVDLRTATASPSTLPSIYAFPRTATALSVTDPVARVSPSIETTFPASPSLVEEPKMDTTESAVCP